MVNKQRADLTFKDNLKRGRHGWVRLTPAYSVKVVQRILKDNLSIHYILEPFSGTGTTGLVAGQYGLDCDQLDINPFLIWLAKVKCANYTQDELTDTREAAKEILHLARMNKDEDALWFPPISNIERWWSSGRLQVLSRLYLALNTVFPEVCPERNLLLVAFCRLVIQWSDAAFNHQSMSFKNGNGQLRLFDETDEMYQSFLNDLENILLAAGEQITGNVRVFLDDSRRITPEANREYDAVITSPPYSNRMSYIRELRPYMYWLGYLVTARDAGELDWQAIGGTWGIATSRLNNWMPENGNGEIPRLMPMIDKIAQSSEVLSRYVHKYFTDMSNHFSSVYDAVAPGGRLYYIIGNSKFYDTIVPTEKLFDDLMSEHGFEDIDVEVLRKRNSKKELFEFLVSARKPF